MASASDPNDDSGGSCAGERRARRVVCVVYAAEADDLFVTGTCDATGLPDVIGVILH